MQLSLLTLLVSTVSVFAADANPDNRRTTKILINQHEYDLDQLPQFWLGAEDKTKFRDLKATLVAPPLDMIRHPLFIQRDVQHIQDAVRKNETNYTWYNVRIQELLFERFMLYDPAYLKMELSNLDSIFEDTYALLYNKLFNNPEIDPWRKSEYQRCMRNIIIKRMPYIEILYKNQLSRNMPDSRTIMSYEVGSRIMEIPNDPRAPEDRMATVLTEASNVLMWRVFELRSSYVRPRT